MRPDNHCALNVALYAPRRGRWAMTERSADATDIGEHRLAIGRSALSWDGAALTITVDEVAAPLPSPVKGVVTVRPRAFGERCLAIDHAGRHRWRPFSPLADVAVSFSAPDMRWSGHGYFDANDGDEPLEDAFARWDWARLNASPDETAILYDAAPRDGPARRIVLRVAGDAVTEEPFPGVVPLPKTALFRMPRAIGCDPDGAAAVVKTLEDAPFYSRSLVRTELFGRRRCGVHESLSGDRLKSTLVRAMLPFRMPRTDR